jgi:SAM-dependent methyltransferase
MGVWHEEDGFWEKMPMFGDDRWEAAPGEVESVVGLLGVETGAAILDLCCGVGRHSLELARLGYRVTGVDRTAAYLRVAQEMATAEDLDLELVEADMRDFARPAAFDGAINLFTSFGYFEDPGEDRLVVENLYRSLRPGGRLVMDMMGKEVLARIFVPRDWRELPDGKLFFQERKVARDWTWMENRWILIDEGQRQEYFVGHRIYDGAGLRELLLGAGFETVDLYGDLDGSPYGTEARRLVAVAKSAG